MMRERPMVCNSSWWWVHIETDYPTFRYIALGASCISNNPILRSALKPCINAVVNTRWYQATPSRPSCDRCQLLFLAASLHLAAAVLEQWCIYVGHKWANVYFTRLRRCTTGSQAAIVRGPLGPGQLGVDFQEHLWRSDAWLLNTFRIRLMANWWISNDHFTLERCISVCMLIVSVLVMNNVYPSRIVFTHAWSKRCMVLDFFFFHGNMSQDMFPYIYMVLHEWL